MLLIKKNIYIFNILTRVVIVDGGNKNKLILAASIPSHQNLQFANVAYL